jgi:hypothetical protein
MRNYTDYGLVQLSNNEGNTVASHTVIARCHRHTYKSGCATAWRT